MKKLSNYCLSIFLCGFAMEISAQQDPQHTHYMYNTLSVNPGYAGSREALNITALHRSQWLGLEGAPKTQTFFVHTPLRNKKMAVGFSMVNDRIGPLNQTFFYLDYSYAVKLSETIKLALGIKGGLNWFQPKIAGLHTITANDPAFVGSTMESTVKPNFGAGLYLHHDFWYFGASVPKLVQSKIDLGTASGDTTVFLALRHSFFIAGAVFPVTSQVKFKPTVLVKIVKNAPVSIDATLEALILERFSVGAGMRLRDSFYGMAGYHITQNFRAGISYDYTSTRLQNINNGTVEIMLSYDFNKAHEKLRSPRYF